MALYVPISRKDMRRLRVRSEASVISDATAHGDTAARTASDSSNAGGITTIPSLRN